MKTTKLIFACLVIMSFGACKKDYQKLATEYERALPDTVKVVLEQINDIYHNVFIMRGDDLYRHSLDDNSDIVIKPQLEEDESVYGLYVGKDNIAFLSFTDTWMNTKFQLYNLKTQKFIDVTKFAGTFHNDVIINPKDSTISGYQLANVESYVRVYYNYDGRIIKEEQEDDPNAGDFNVPNLKYWQCIYCQLVVKSPNKPAEKGTRCPVRNNMFYPHVWQYIGDAQ